MLAKSGNYKVFGSNFRPDYITDSVADINFDALKKQGITTCLIDLDGTVVARGTYEVSETIKRALRKAPLKIYIATNRPKSRELKTLREDLSANGVVHPKGIYGKPSKRYFANALKELGIQSSEAVMVGDRFIQDIFGANRAGISTILVSKKIGPPQGWLDMALTRSELRLALRLGRKYTDIK
jgi:hypothetical protein